MTWRVLAIAAFYGAAFYFIEHAFDFSLAQTDFDVAQSAITVIARGSATRPVAFLALAAVGILMLIFAKRRGSGYDRVFFIVVLAYVFWIFLTYLWADAPLLALKRSVSFLLMMTASFACYRTCTRREFLEILFLISAGYVAFGVFAEFTVGTLRPFSTDYRFSGTLHPEGQGFNCAVLFLAAFTLADLNRGKRRGFYRVVAAAALLFLLLVRARAPFAAVIAAYLVYFVLTRHLSRNMRFGYFALMAISTITLFFGGGSLVRAFLLGRTDQVGSLTGRIPLWKECWEFVEKRPLTGYGYNSFWSEDRAWLFSDTQDWVISTSHSMYIETMLNIGLIGFLLLMTILVISARNGLKLFKVTQEIEIAAMLGYLVLIFVDGVLSSIAVEGGFVTFILFTLAFFLSSSLQEAGFRNRRLN